MQGVGRQGNFAEFWKKSSGVWTGVDQGSVIVSVSCCGLIGYDLNEIALPRDEIPHFQVRFQSFDGDLWPEMGLHRRPGHKIRCPMIMGHPA